ncbi:MAG: MBL fold metallo-hydrolase [Bacteroidia bacterium]|nr:MBL fold metallo-hydrolase [Bacteroidia bacterium]
MKVILHGTRGAYPTSTPDNQKYGGDTPCIELIHNDDRLIIDAGTGIIGIDWNQYDPTKRLDILLTHLHMDHIQGLGFCKPLFDPNREVHIWGPGGSIYSLQTRLNRFLSPPLFPVVLRDIPSQPEIHELSNTKIELGPFTVHSSFIIHPGPTLGYRVTCDGKSLTYIPDHEPMIGRTKLYDDDSWVSGFDLAYETDLLIHDSQYENEEYIRKIGWGHSSMQISAEFAARTKAGRLVFFHHDPAHNDQHRSSTFEAFMSKNSFDFPIELAVQGQEIEI